MCELLPIPYFVFLLPKKETSRKKKLLEQPQIKNWSNSNTLIKKIYKT